MLCCSWDWRTEFPDAAEWAAAERRQVPLHFLCRRLCRDAQSHLPEMVTMQRQAAGTDEECTVNLCLFK